MEGTMSENENGVPGAGWMHAEGDPPGTVRYWNGMAWHGEPQPVGPPASGPQPPGLRPLGQTESPEKAGWSGRRKTVAVLGLALVAVGGLFTWTYRAGNAQLEAGNEFLGALQSRDFVAAASLVAPECSGDGEIDAAWLEAGFVDVRLVDFALQTDSVGLTNGDQTGRITGTAMFETRGLANVEIGTINRGGWLVCSWDFIPPGGS